MQSLGCGIHSHMRKDELPSIPVSRNLFQLKGPTTHRTETVTFPFSHHPIADNLKPLASPHVQSLIFKKLESIGPHTYGTEEESLNFIYR